MKPTFHIQPSSLAYQLRNACMRCNWYRANRDAQDFFARLESQVDFKPYNVIDASFKKSVTIEWLRSRGVPAKTIIKPPKLRGVLETDLCKYAMTGYPDVVVILDDDSIGVVELKCTAPTPQTFLDYGPQVAAYKHMDSRISRAWLLFYELRGFLSLPEGLLTGDWTIEELDFSEIDLGAECDRLGRFFVMPKPPMEFHCDECRMRDESMNLWGNN